MDPSNSLAFLSQMSKETVLKGPCCDHEKTEQQFNDLMAGIQNNADAQWVKNRLQGIAQSLGAKFTGNDAVALRELAEKVLAELGANPKYADSQGVGDVVKAGLDVVIAKAQAGPHPTTEQQLAIGQLALKVDALARHNQLSAEVIHELKLFFEPVVRQAEAINPLFALSAVSTPAPDAVPHTEASSKPTEAASTKETVVEVRQVAAEPHAHKEHQSEKASPAPEIKAPLEERREAPAGSAMWQEHKNSEVAPAAAPHHSSFWQVSQSFESSSNQATPTSSWAHSTVSNTVPSPSGASTPQVSAPQSSSPSSHVAPTPPSPSTVSRVSTPSHVSTVFTHAAQRVAPVTPAQQPSATMSARVFARGAPQNQQSSRVVASKGSAGSRPAQSARPAGGRAPGERLNRNGVPKGATPTSRVGRDGRIAVTREPVTSRGVRGARSEARIKQPRERITAKVSQALHDPRGKNVAARSLVQGGRGAKQDGAIRQGHEKGALGIRADGRIDVRGASVANVPVRQIAAVLAQLRALSPKELKGLRPDRFDKPADLQLALAIRFRAQRLMERIKNIPLKDIEKMKGFNDPRDPKRAMELPTLSPREMLARREVRLAIKDLSARLQSFLNPRSLLYRRVTTELTLADLERLVSILGGNRAVKGLRKKHKAGEVTQVVESDISNSFLSQLASAADGPAASGDSGGSDESSPAQEGGGPETSTEASVEESTLVADVAVPTATLTTVLMKEETAGGSPHQ